MGVWYKQWYLTTKQGEDDLRAALADPDSGAQTLADIKKRLSELKLINDDRCHICLDQRRFLERILSTL